MTSYIQTLDWVVFSFCFLTLFIFLYIGHRIAPKEKSLLESLVMGRALTLPLFIGTLVSTWYGGIFGVTSIAYSQGIYNFITQGVFWYFTYILFALFIVDRIAKYPSLTLAHLVEQRLGKKAGKIAALLNFTNLVPISYTISLGLFFQLIFGGSPILWSFIALVIVTLYASFGGLRAVIFTDFIQFILMILGVLLVFIFSISSHGGWSFLKQNLPVSHFDPLGGESILTLIMWGIIALSTLADPNFYQRCFAAKDTRTAKKGILISTFIWFCFDICTTGGALYAKAVMPDLDPGNAYFVYAIKTLPDGFRGIFLAGVLATILSTLDSYLFLGGATLAHDLINRLKRLKVLGITIGVFITSILSFLLSLGFHGNIKQVWKLLGSLSSATLILPLLCIYFLPKRINERSFIFSVALSSIAVIISEITQTWLNSIYYGIATSLFSLLLFNFYQNRKINGIHLE